MRVFTSTLIGATLFATIPSAPAFASEPSAASPTDQAEPPAPTPDTEPTPRPLEPWEKPPPLDQQYQVDGDPATDTHPWAMHDLTRPLPPVVDPGSPSIQTRAGRPPSDAIVLFDGNAEEPNLNAWETVKADSPGWHVAGPYFQVTPGAGAIRTKQAFGDVQLHLEWKVSASEAGDYGQSRGNSGVFLMGRYEVQIGDHLHSPTYADGMAGAIYGQAPPLVNAGMGLDRWQTFDIIFRAPHFDEAGELTQPATITVLHNGVLIHDHWQIEGSTHYKKRPTYPAAHGNAPIRLQDHGNPVQFRNVWVRQLP